MSFWYRDAMHVSANVRSTKHEHRAPTDESIRLAGEYQDKARQELLDQTVHVEEGGIRLKYAIWREDYASADYELRWQFELDGVPQNGKHRISHRQYGQFARDKGEFYRWLCGEIAQVVANRLVLRLLSKKDDI